MVITSELYPKGVQVWENRYSHKYYYKEGFGFWGICICASKYKHSNLESFIEYAKGVVKKKIEDKYGNTK